jgi:hypothetical protein
LILPADLKVRSFLGADAVSFSEIGTLARCESAWQYGYTGEREETGASKAMALGTEVHRLWGQYQMDAPYADTEDATAAWLMNRYAEYYDCRLNTIDVEVPVVAKLPGGPYFFGFADALFAYKRELWVGELKTTATLTNVDYLEQTLQTPLYVWALRQMGVPVVGAMLDVIRSYKPVRKELPLADSFDRRWHRWSDAELVPKVAEAMSANLVRQDLESGRRIPLRNIGSSCSWCSSQAVCFGLDVELADEDEVQPLQSRRGHGPDTPF